MSDYISKSALIELVKEEIKQDRPDNFKIRNIQRYIEDAPTISETEIIRKAFEKVLENLAECTEQTYYKSVEGDLDASQRNLAYHQAIAIIKEECGINE